MKLIPSIYKNLFVQMEHNDPNIYAPMLLNCMLMQFNLNSCWISFKLCVFEPMIYIVYTKCTQWCTIFLFDKEPLSFLTNF